MAAGDRMDKYGDFAHIDMLATVYNYTHQQAQDLTWEMVMTIIVLNREKAYIEAAAAQSYKESKQ